MNYIADGFINAFYLLINGHDETYNAIANTLIASSASISISQVVFGNRHHLFL